MVYDTIPSYRLDSSIIEGYLRKKFGNYKFYVEVGNPDTDAYYGQLTANSSMSMTPTGSGLQGLCQM